jgi:N-methylhydantoinase A
MLDEGVAPEAIRLDRTLDMSYVGQSFELSVPYAADFVERFHRRHEQRYGYEDSTRPTQVVNIRLRLTGASGTVYQPHRAVEQRGDARQAQVDTIAMFTDNGRQEAPVYDRQLLQPGDRFSGPALVSEYSATTVVPADFSARIDGQGNLMLRAGR